MKKFFLAFLVVIIPAIVAAAEQQKPKKPENATTLHPSRATLVRSMAQALSK